MLLNDSLKEKQMDIRLRDKLLAEGKISAKDVKNYLTSLDNDEKNLAFTNEKEDDSQET